MSNIQPGLLSCNASYAHPVTARRNLFEADTHMTFKLNSKWVTVPEISNPLLFCRKLAGSGVNFVCQFVEVRSFALIECSYGTFDMNRSRINKEPAYRTPV